MAWNCQAQSHYLNQRRLTINRVLWQFHNIISQLTLKHRETHECVVSTVATDALVLKYQAISIHNADETFIVLDQFHLKLLHIRWTASENEITFWKKLPSHLRVKCVWKLHIHLDSLLLGVSELTYWGLIKTATNLHIIYLKEKMCILTEISLKSVPKGPIDSMS